jgi:16S rRNA (uracil1498-N3)-methyltransferase
MTRVHADVGLEPGREFALPRTAANHVVRVLRMRVGAELCVFDGRGHDYRCLITGITDRQVDVRVVDRLAGLAEPRLRVTLVQAVSRGERMDWTLQKAVELGVHEIVPVLSARCVVRLEARQIAPKLRHWQGVVASACEQCGRSRLPSVRPPVELREFLAGPAPARSRLVLGPDSPASLAGLASLGDQVELLVGPEGGFSDSESEAIAESRFRSVRLGPRVLRTETAGVAALAILQALWGDLQ